MTINFDHREQRYIGKLKDNSRWAVNSSVINNTFNKIQELLEDN